MRVCMHLCMSDWYSYLCDDRFEFSLESEDIVATFLESEDIVATFLAEPQQSESSPIKAKRLSLTY